MEALLEYSTWAERAAVGEEEVAPAAIAAAGAGSWRLRSCSTVQTARRKRAAAESAIAAVRNDPTYDGYLAADRGNKLLAEHGCSFSNMPARMAGVTDETIRSTASSEDLDARIRFLGLLLALVATASAQQIIDTDTERAGEGEHDAQRELVVIRGCNLYNAAKTACRKCIASQKPSAVAVTRAYALVKGKCVMTVNIPWKYSTKPYPLITARAGDKITFKYVDTNPHSVWAVSPKDVCNFKSATAKQLFGTTQATATAKPAFTTKPLTAGAHAYACATTGHCTGGKMFVKVAVR
ncbi:hypothetical protein JKP88DRAFT_328014 [Tribonema minus]|uniref:Phytocyanin domain-containing protein n=1 Tax=Tribonema minus TaxID=303371 RepID=A0A835YSV7_9STRA|nr:hypothetical protein JKP88DRAFT_328014 [Tribonema minus]